MSAFEEQTNQFVQQIKSGVSSILVAVRVRPLSLKERKISNFETVKVLQRKLLSLIDPETQTSTDILRKNRSKQIQYAFDYTFDQETATKSIYEKTVSILLDGLLDGYNASVFAYGATSCGKTYTMVGENENSPGLMAMAVLELLNIATQKKKYQQIKLKGSYIQIYNENIKDLLISEDRNLQIREDPKEGISIPGITEVIIQNVNQLKTVLKVGNRNRTMESTGSNQVSSRSHGIFQISLEIKDKTQSTIDETIMSKLMMIDLAGSERASNTTNRGMRMVQGAKINQSLLVLGNCIQALSEASEKGLKNAYIPYRGSKLTRLLKDSLGGNCRTVMIAHVSPATSLFQQTYNTLIYAHRAKNIKNNPIRNTLIAQTHLSNYVNVINNLKRENQELKLQIRKKDMNSLQKQKGSPKGNPILPVIDNQGYNEQVSKWEIQITKQFNQQDRIEEKILEIQLKLQKIAFFIFEKQLQKNGQKFIQPKNNQAAELTKEKLKLEKRLQDKRDSRRKILKQIEKNDILGTNGANHLKNIYKQKKIQSELKVIKWKQQILKEEKKQMDKLIKKIKSSMSNHSHDSAEKDKFLVKKNNIISRITYSQIDHHENNQFLQSQVEHLAQPKVQYSQRKPIVNKKIKFNNYEKYENSIDSLTDERTEGLSKQKQRRGERNERRSALKNVHKIVRVDNSIQQNKRRHRKESPQTKQQRLVKNNSEYLKLQKLNSVKKNKSSKIQAPLDFIYMQH